VIEDATLLEKETSEQPQDPPVETCMVPVQPAAEEAVADGMEGEEEADFLERYLAERDEPAQSSQESGAEEKKESVEDDSLDAVDSESAQFEQSEYSGRRRRAPRAADGIELGTWGN
jgi:hypothetical protein